MQALLREVVLLVALLSGIPLMISSLCALMVAVVQAATQVQEQSITFLVKFLIMSGICLLCGDIFFTRIIELFINLCEVAQHG